MAILCSVTFATKQNRHVDRPTNDTTRKPLNGIIPASLLTHVHTRGYTTRTLVGLVPYSNTLDQYYHYSISIIVVVLYYSIGLETKSCRIS